MNWYIIKIADDFANYLKTVGATQDVIDYVLSITDQKVRNFLVGILRKNPKITLNELKNVGVKQNDQKSPYWPDEIRIAKRWASNFTLNMNMAQMEQWALVNLRKARNGLSEEQFKDKPFSIKDRYFIVYNYFEANRWIELNDWLDATGSNIASFDFTEALNASNQWHIEMADKGANQKYQEKHIVYGPQWKNPKYNGWTIQEVKSKNDLEVEGNKCDQCVGSYDRDVWSGRLRIFSLRDPQNQPHVTIESNPDVTSFAQVMGKSNSDPKPEYKVAVKEWVESLGHPVYSDENDWGQPDSVREYEKALINVGHNTLGLATMPPNWEILINNIIKQNNYDHPRSKDQYYGDITNIDGPLVNAAIFYGKEEFSKFIGEMSEARQKAEEDLYGRWESNLEDYLDQSSRPQEPDPNDYEEGRTDVDYRVDMSKYDKALEQWEEKARDAESNEQSEWMSKHLPFGLYEDIFKYVQQLHDTGKIPKDWPIY